ncbi:hypothetical protein [Ekhidna sp.]|uniref:hypothetical protein n=1 Tax=Ekhidna sp. TaxID=2608089 RepID=UPI003B50E45F
MEFEEMQKIWSEQKGETMYAINESALHKRIGKKKDAASKRINMVEILISIINGVVAIILFIDALGDSHNWDFMGAGIMAATVIYIQYFRWKRIASENKFDRSMIGELDHAISNTNHIVRFSYLMIVGYLAPMSVYLFAKMISQGASLEKWLLIVGLYLLSFLLIYWERKTCHIPRQRNLIALKRKLIEECN